MWKIKGWSWICPEKKSTWSDLNDLNQKENRWVQYKAKDWRFQESNGQVSSDMGFWFNIKWHWWTKKQKHKSTVPKIQQAVRQLVYLTLGVWVVNRSLKHCPIFRPHMTPKSTWHKMFHELKYWTKSSHL
jgi:hypothetical protein